MAVFAAVRRGSNVDGLFLGVPTLLLGFGAVLRDPEAAAWLLDPRHRCLTSMAAFLFAASAG